MTSPSRLAGIATLALVGLALLTGSASAQEEISLPQQMGAINDYAASLGRQTREHLQSQVDRLSSEANVDLAVLISLIDPFGDPARYAEAIWSQWELGSERSVLLVYVRAAESRWVFRARGSSDVSDQLSTLRVGQTRSAIDDALADRDVAEAVRAGVDALTAQWAPVTDSPSSADGTTGSDSATSSSDGAAATAQPAESPWWQPLWAWIAGGVALLLGILALVVWALLTWFCPRCGSRLRRRTATPRPGERAGRGEASRSVYSCPNCRYVRRPRHGRRNRRTTRRTRGERRRAAGRR